MSTKIRRTDWTEQELKDLMKTNDRVLYSCLIRLYECQTADEQNSGTTKEHNGIGFNGVDAKFLTSAAQFLNKTGFLTAKQKVSVRKSLMKYSKQLTKLANKLAEMKNAELEVQA